MRVLILAAMIIVFISTFFIFFITDKMIGNYAACTAGVCDFSGSTAFFIFSLSAIGIFVLISSIAVYLVITTVSRTAYRPPSV